MPRGFKKEKGCINVGFDEDEHGTDVMEEIHNNLRQGQIFYRKHKVQGVWWYFFSNTAPISTDDIKEFLEDLG